MQDQNSGRLEIQELAPSELVPWKENPRYNNKAVEVVVKSIETFGFNVPILCDMNKMIIAGHTRWKAALRLKLKKVPVIQLELSEKFKKAFALVDNKSTEFGEWDVKSLSTLITETQSEKIHFDELGFSKAELDALFNPLTKFKWDDFDTRLLSCVQEEYMSIPFKVHKKKFSELIDKLAKYKREYKIKEPNKALANGNVLIMLLEGKNG